MFRWENVSSMHICAVPQLAGIFKSSEELFTPRFLQNPETLLRGPCMDPGRETQEKSGAAALRIYILVYI